VQADRHIAKCSTILHRPNPPSQSRRLQPASPNARGGGGGSSDATAQAAIASASGQQADLVPGAAVRLHSLSGAVHLNGATGVLHSFDAGAQRWIVVVAGDWSCPKALRRDNLQLVSHGPAGGGGGRPLTTTGLGVGDEVPPPPPPFDPAAGPGAGGGLASPKPGRGGGPGSGRTPGLAVPAHASGGFGSGSVSGGIERAMRASAQKLPPVHALRGGGTCRQRTTMVEFPATGSGRLKSSSAFGAGGMSATTRF